MGSTQALPVHDMESSQDTGSLWTQMKKMASAGSKALQSIVAETTKKTATAISSAGVALGLSTALQAQAAPPPTAPLMPPAAPLAAATSASATRHFVVTSPITAIDCAMQQFGVSSIDRLMDKDTGKLFVNPFETIHPGSTIMLATSPAQAQRFSDIIQKRNSAKTPDLPTVLATNPLAPLHGQTFSIATGANLRDANMSPIGTLRSGSSVRLDASRIMLSPGKPLGWVFVPVMTSTGTSGFVGLSRFDADARGRIQALYRDKNTTPVTSKGNKVVHAKSSRPPKEPIQISMTIPQTPLLANAEKYGFHMEPYMQSIARTESGGKPNADNTPLGIKLKVDKSRFAGGMFAFSRGTLKGYGIVTDDQYASFLNDRVRQEQIMVTYTNQHLDILLNHNAMKTLLDQGVQLTKAMMASHHMGAPNVLRIANASVKTADPVKNFEYGLSRVHDWIGTSTSKYIHGTANTYEMLLQRHKASQVKSVSGEEVSGVDSSATTQTPSSIRITNAISHSQKIQNIVPPLSKIETNPAANDPRHSSSAPSFDGYLPANLQSSGADNNVLRNISASVSAQPVNSLVGMSALRSITAALVSEKTPLNGVTARARDIISRGYTDAKFARVFISEAEEVLKNNMTAANVSQVAHAKIHYAQLYLDIYQKLFSLGLPSVNPQLKQAISETTSQIEQLQNHMNRIPENRGQKFYNEVTSILRQPNNNGVNVSMYPNDLGNGTGVIHAAQSIRAKNLAELYQAPYKLAA